MSAELLRNVAADMREQHGPDHPRHEMWQAMADWLEGCADRLDITSDTRIRHDPEEQAWYFPALAVARAYPHPDTDPSP